MDELSAAFTARVSEWKKNGYTAFDAEFDDLQWAEGRLIWKGKNILETKVSERILAYQRITALGHVVEAKARNMAEEILKLVRETK